jgi:o-succinylbenzoate synthase
MLYQVEFHPYQRRFLRPLATSHGNWEVREGISLSLVDETGRVGKGEIAPIPWFGSETLEQALEFCHKLPSQIAITDIFSIPSELPACQFGFESAWERVSGQMGREEDDAGKEDWSIQGCSDRVISPANLSAPSSPSQSKIQNPNSKITYSYLLPTGETALKSWQIGWERGSRTFKWKIGVASIEDELEVFHRLVQALPPTAQLRLDANGGLTRQQASRWLKVAQEAGRVEFLEQPLPPEQFETMLEMSDRYSTPIALDESVATLKQLEDCYQRGWRGIFVIKVAIAGSPRRLRQFCREHEIDAVFSSVFETAIGRQAALQLAAELSLNQRAVGFGVNHWFVEEQEQE